MFHSITRLPEFEKDLKRLLKRFRTLDDDLDVFLRIALVDYHKNGVDNGGIVRIADLGIETPSIYKARKFACRSLKGKGVHSGMRVIYAYFDNEDRIELMEIYYKGDRAGENKQRILKYHALLHR
ncbi:MAG: hypothetical protein HYZ34_04185 [Ignavibacteriae bacterium]|nr:hypothetical protein [Ignavibacteriota bacterium]